MSSNENASLGHRLCSICGVDLVPGAAFCAACGHSVSESLDGSALPSKPSGGDDGSWDRGRYKLPAISAVVVVLLIAGGVAIALAGQHSTSRASAADIRVKGPAVSGIPTTSSVPPTPTPTTTISTRPSNQAQDQCAGCDGSGSGPGVGSSTGTVTPEQQFAIDTRPVPLVAGGTIGDAIDGGLLNSAAVGVIGDDVCNDFSFWTSPPYSSSIPYMDEVIQLEHGDTAKVHLSFSLDQSGAETFVSQAIADICSNEQSIIPYGDPGAP
jgi:hypothetical protein